MLLLIISPAVNAEEREQTVDIEFKSDFESPFRQNILSQDQMTLNMETWAIQPKGVYSGPIMSENIMQFDFQLRSNQVTSNLISNEPALRQIIPTEEAFFGYDYNIDSDLNCYAETISSNNPDDDYTNDFEDDYDCLGLPEDWSNSDNSITDPYGRDDMGKIWSDYKSSPDIISYETNIPLWGEDSYRSYFAASVPVQFSHQDIMSGASEFWVRTPIDGKYNPANSQLAIFEIDDINDIEFGVEPNSILNNTAWNGEWQNPIAYTPPEMIRNADITHANGNLIYENSLNGHSALAFDFSEAVCATVDNGTNDADSGSNPYISSNGKNLEAVFQSSANMYCPEGNFPIIQSESIPVHSTQTLQLPTEYDTSLTSTSWDRTYHRVNSFIYPNQPYLFVFLLELEESNPIISWTAEDANGPGQETFIRYGEYNFSNPFNDDGQLNYLRNPHTHNSNTERVPLDSGTSFVFTQGQSQDMAGYRFHADNTTVSFMKELPEAVSHSPGADGKFDWYDGDPAVNDDELDFVSLYMPFINHERKDITIEYMALAYEVQDDGDVFLKQWMNASRMGCFNDTRPQGTGFSSSSANWDNMCEDPLDTEDYYGMSEMLDAKHNYYYSGFWYLGYPDEGLSIRPMDGSTGTALEGFSCAYSDLVNWGTNCRSDDFQRRAGVLNDETTNPEYFRKQHTDYFLHTSELIPENGTTHILYLFKFAGTHHWQSNIEDVCFYCDAQNPFTPAEFTSSANEAGTIQEMNRITSFNKDRDSDGDGRTDTDCLQYSCQQNTTDITLLIQKPSSKTGERELPLPIWGVGPNMTCISRSTFNFNGVDPGTISSDNVTTCPGTFSAPINGWAKYQEVHDRVDGYRIDGARNELIVSSADWFNPLGIWCTNDRIQLGFGAINGYGWNTAKPCVTDDSLQGWSNADNKGEDRARGVYEINGRSATYTSIHDYEFHSTELMASASLTSGRWTEVKGTSTGFDYLDNTFRHKIVERNIYELTIVTSNYDVPECPVGTTEVDGLNCADSGDVALRSVISDTVNVLKDVGHSCNPVSVNSQAAYWDVTYDMDWDKCGSSIKDAIAGVAQYDWGTFVEGAQALYGNIEDAIGKAWEQIKGLGEWFARVAVDAMGIITSLFHEIGAHMDEIVTGFLYLAGLLGLSFFLQMIVRFGATILISIERRGAA